MLTNVTFSGMMSKVARRQAEQAQKLFWKVSKKELTKLNECDKIIESARESADEKMDLEN